MDKEGILVINKRSGMTSHDVVSQVRRIFKMRAVGHAGTLDPMATGVLILLLGKATKLFDRFVAFDKAYRATLRLGIRTDSADITGTVIEEKEYASIDQQRIKDVFVRFVGDIDQFPPMVSAVKHKGERLYRLARQGVVVERTARRVRIDRLDVLEMKLPDVAFFMACSKGTYVRQLAEDVGQALGCGACITQIERTKVGPFDINDAVALEDVHESCIRSF